MSEPGPGERPAKAHARGSTPGHVPHGHKFPAERWERLVSPDRHRLLDPVRMLDDLDVRSGMTVADLGAGPGFFTLPLADRVGPAGTVYATDVSADMLRVLESRGLPGHVRLVLAEESRFGIPDAVADVALLAFVLHELSHPLDFLGEVRRILRPGGRLAVLEWVPKDEPIGPPLAERMSEEHASEVLAAGGFVVTRRGDANRSQYFMVAEAGS